MVVAKLVKLEKEFLKTEDVVKDYQIAYQHNTEIEMVNARHVQDMKDSIGMETVALE